MLRQVQRIQLDMSELHCILNYFITIIGLTHISPLSFLPVCHVSYEPSMYNSKTSNQNKGTVDKNSNPAVLSVCMSFFIHLTALMKKLMSVCSSCLQTDTEREAEAPLVHFFLPTLASVESWLNTFSLSIRPAAAAAAAETQP